jgi:hypothetical protein
LKRLDFTDVWSFPSGNDPNHFSLSVPSLPVGSVQIDEALQEEIERRLALIPQEYKARIATHAVDDMTREQFQDIKIEFGTMKVRLLKEFHLRVPGLPLDFSNEGAKIENGLMIFAQ